MNSTKKFLDSIPKLEPVEFLGLCGVLGVKLYADAENKEPRDFLDMLTDLCEAFAHLNRARRREILSIMGRAMKEKVPGDEQHGA